MLRGVHVILIVASKEDVASMNIAQKIIDHYGFRETSETFHQNPVYSKGLKDQEACLIFVNDRLIDTQYIGDFFHPQLFIYISRHSSVSGIPTLSVHTPGNLGEAPFGGIPRRVSVSPASAMKEALLELMRKKEELALNYEVSYECTHHGPSLDAPAMFVELGSSMKQWEDQKAAEAVAHAAMAAASSESKYSTMLGIGGPHYPPKFTKMALDSSRAFGHIIPKYAVLWMDSKIIRHCVERTVEEVEAIILDWKGIKGEDKDKLISALNEIGLPIERV